jgi:hypothetical protein
LEVCRRGIADPSLDIYSDEDKTMFARWTTTPAQYGNFLKTYEGQPYRTEIQGSRAVLVYAATKRRLAPIFLKRERGGWVLDFATAFRAVKFTHKNYWYLAADDHPYMFALRKYFVFDKHDYPHFRKGVHDWSG